MPFSFADLEVGRGFATTVGGRSILRGFRLALRGRGGKRIERRGELRGFVHLAFAGVFVRHCELLRWLWRDLVVVLRKFSKR